MEDTLRDELVKQRIWRHRINVSTTSKGVHSYDCTVESTNTGFTQEEVLAESDRLVAALDARYHPSHDEPE